jgi:hypothetical protein
VFVGRWVCYQIVMQYGGGGDECKTVEHDSFTVYIKKCAFQSCNTVDSRSCEGLPLRFFKIITLVLWVFGRLKIWHLVREHSKNLFAYRDVTSRPVCVSAYWHMAVQTPDLIARLTGRHEKMKTIKLCGFKTAADPSVHWQASIHQFTWQRGMNKWGNCVNGTLL